MLHANEPAIGVIGGSGLYELEGLQKVERVELETPFGTPSDAFITGELEGQKMVFLPRHGSKHGILPHEINFRANIWGMKKLGAARLISVSAVGSLQEQIVPGHLVLVDQFIDWTKQRPQTFLGEGVVGHIALADPVCLPLQHRLNEVAKDLQDITVHEKGTYVCIEGPQFSTRAESHMYRSWGADVIGMTNMPEARLAREAEIGYATIALATDYDCWKEDEAHVETEAVLQILRANVEKAKTLLSAYVRAEREPLCPEASTALRTGLITPIEQIPESRRQALAPLLDPIVAKS